ncbi:MAG: alpha/beta hydrolase [Elusimicrobia bacterium]|nr:alpha/beta hydrolase [Elusimicrobiota bacterium]
MFVVAFAGNTKRETAFDRKVHIEKGIIKEVLHIPPLCDIIPGLKREKIDIDDGKLYYEEEGSGPALLLISGGPGCTHHIFHPYFSKAKDFARVIYFDQRGTGQSDYDDSTAKYSIRQAVRDIEALRKKLSINKWLVLGHSYGGFLAQCYVLEYPGNVAGLILVTASPGMAEPYFEKSRQHDLISKEERDKMAAISEEKNISSEARIYNNLLNGDWKKQDYYKPSKEEMARIVLYEWRPSQSFNSAMAMDARRIDLTGKFKDFEIPTLLVESENDLTWDEKKPEILKANHPGAEMVVFEKSAHSPFADEPEKFFKVLRDFTARSAKNSENLYVRSGSRMTWPPEIIGKIEGRPLEFDEQVPALFEEAKKTVMTDIAAWEHLGIMLYGGKYYNKALFAFQNTGKCAEPQNANWKALTWQGLILDLLHKRDEAVACYKAALAVCPDRSAKYDQYNLKFNKQWLEERIKIPYSRQN